ncbi:MAG: DinB family protein [Frankiales bacterium]|nr:DinB family protein [Frankiales bacterium]
MTIEPDTKDWTWVLNRPCPECGFDSRSFPRDQVGAMVRGTAAEWQTVLRRSDVRRRPDPATWSPLEYACHVRDVFRLYAQRLEMMLQSDDPAYPNWDQDATAIEERYAEQDAAVVAAELATAADDIAGRFDRVVDDEWARTGRRSDGATFTVETFARYFIHDPIHHLHDVGAT